MTSINLQLCLDDEEGGSWPLIAGLLQQWCQRHSIGGYDPSLPDPAVACWLLSLTTSQNDILSLTNDLYALLYDQGVNLEIDFADQGE